MEAVLSSPPVVLVAVVLALGLGAYGVQKYQRCPHCGRLVRRAFRGWLRCTGCGRQWRRGLRVR
ncbi:MAG TPA: hypothetical protein VFR64_12090 [Methylomirabilota bacterium]|nr:hypothetical protein [Methylomirabilota bacterium]